MEMAFGLLEKEEVLLIGWVGLPIGMRLAVGGVVVALRCIPLRHLTIIFKSNQPVLSFKSHIYQSNKRRATE